MGFSKKNGHIYAAVDIGFPLLSSPFYLALGPIGLQIFNSLITSLTVAIVYFGARKLFDETTARTAAPLYLFCTISIFYATSMWHHSLATMGFILAQVSFLYMRDDKRFSFLFALGCAIAVWSAYYMILPILVLLLAGKGKKHFILVPIFLSLCWIYNAHVFGSFHGDFGIQMHSFQPKTIDNLIAMVIWREHVLDPWMRWKIQKSLLESSPFLVLSILGLATKRCWPLIASNVLYLIGVASHTPSDFGGWEFSMRYLLPIIPFGTILSSAFISGILREKTKYLPMLFFLL
jgi:4-amino-4-deoxy-L-arabinose transferase-like glycosyltransferase